MTDKEAIESLEAQIECNKLWVSCEHDCSTEKCESCKLTYAKGNMREQRECFEIAVKAIKMRENIQWLIEQYEHQVETLEQDLHENSGISVGNSYKTGKKGVYGKVIADLKEVLNEDTT